MSRTHPQITDLENPAFAVWVKRHHPVPITPDEADLEPTPAGASDEEQAQLYREAQARKLIRLYREWVASDD